MSAYELISEGVITINAIPITIDAPGNYDRYRERDDVLYMAKGLGQIDTYVDFACRLAEQGKIVHDAVELGIFRGGSAVFLHQLLGYPHLVCIDGNPQSIPRLELYRSIYPNVRTYYGVNQADRMKIRQAVEVECPDGIDLVIDDASHFYEETKIAFETLFPFLRPGGMYLIEDWGWPHVPAAQAPDHMWAQKSALTNLIFELVMAVANEIRAFRELRCGIGFVCVERGPLPLPTDGSFRLDNYLLTRGKPLGLI
jgi:hypothetical protein